MNAVDPSERSDRPLRPLSPGAQAKARVVGQLVEGSARAIGDAGPTPCPGSGASARHPENLTECCARCGQRVLIDHGDILVEHTAASLEG